jgi:hypothetical protein
MRHSRRSFFFRLTAAAHAPPRDASQLGPVIEPPQTVRMGKVWPNARTWAALDLLLTCETVSEARDKTNELAAAGAA